MEYERFNMTGVSQLYENDCMALDDLLGDEKIKIREIAVSAKEHVYVFYEQKTELVDTETERVKCLRNIAKEIKDNRTYGNRVYEKLTNAKQRSLFLCELCHISKSDAEDVMELMNILEAEASVLLDEALLKAKAKLDKKEEEENRKLKLEEERTENERIHRKEMK